MFICFPGANTGDGFASCFDGILPPWEPPHYTYILKGGPGVGKNTLMRRVAKAAEDKGEAVESFPCTSDPDSLDAIRLPDRRVILLDGTSPHTADPDLPGIGGEIVNLGHFRDPAGFAKKRPEIERLTAENRTHYARAYAMLSAAQSLRRSVQDTVRTAVDTDALRKAIYDRIGGGKPGENRVLFAKSATPDGVRDFTASFCPEGTWFVSGTVGELALSEAEALYRGRSATVGKDFLPGACAVRVGTHAIALSKDGEALDAYLRTPLPEYIAFCLPQIDLLTAHAVSELSAARKAHDGIEAVYRPYVDFDRVCAEGDALLARLGL